MKKILVLSVISLITILTLVYALWNVDFHELGRLLSGGDYFIVFPILLLLVVFYWIKAVRYCLILRPIGHYKRSEVTPSIIIGFAGNNVLPAHLGELVRLVVFSRKYSQPISSVGITLLVERILDVAAILAWYAAGMAAIGKPPESLEIGAGIIMLLTVCFFLAIAIILYKPSLVHVLGDRLGTLLPEAAATKLSGILHNVILAFSSLRSPPLLIMMVILSLVKWGIMAVIIWLSLVAYGTYVTVAIALILMAVLAFAAAVPNAPGYIGAMQAAYVFTLRPFGISEEIAIAASVLFLVCQWLPVTLAGAYYFITGGLHVDEVRREVELVEEGGNQ